MANCDNHTQTREQITEITEKVKVAHNRLNEHEKRLDDMDVKIDYLQKSDATNTNEIKNLCSQIGSQTKAIWGLVSSIGLMLAGFLIWYIQSL